MTLSNDFAHLRVCTTITSLDNDFSSVVGSTENKGFYYCILNRNRRDNNKILTNQIA